MQTLTHVAHLTLGELGLGTLLFVAGLLLGLFVAGVRLRAPR